jgi:hypothetical protein
MKKKLKKRIVTDRMPRVRHTQEPWPQPPWKPPPFLVTIKRTGHGGLVMETNTYGDYLFFDRVYSHPHDLVDGLASDIARKLREIASVLESAQGFEFEEATILIAIKKRSS